MKKIAVVLAGCGVFDGAEIHEATLSLLAIDRAGASYEIFAPDIEQAHVVNHLTGKPTEERRNVLVESARIARGKINNLVDFDSKKFDALLFPGGFGVAKNLCDYAFKGPDMSVNADVRNCVMAMYSAKKPIGALCISPVLIAGIIGAAEVTIGNDTATADHIAAFGGQHIEASGSEIVIDRQNKIVTSPCYMLDANISTVYDGARKVVEALFQLVEE
ncbi:MAG: isoprenoid biosynthesis protein ElbB [Bacteroidetes bacterium HGW-Bacteroidetes-6]|jgi:enhancing lycopene biosynthesis protein 2|nr:MAG: isoprenoid biosynthesis protein ElbB [Bacteroidetes bacterium HGW-Bacteroidetes-6]